MTLDEALEILVARTGHERFRDLVDPNNPAFDPAYPPWVIAQAAVGPAAPDEPGLLQKAANLTRSIVTHVAAGMPVADDATVEARWTTCRACEMLDAENAVCRACGCNLNVKVRWAGERCPIGKW